MDGYIKPIIVAIFIFGLNAYSTAYKSYKAKKKDTAIFSMWFSLHLALLYRIVVYFMQDISQKGLVYSRYIKPFSVDSWDYDKIKNYDHEKIIHNLVFVKKGNQIKLYEQYINIIDGLNDYYNLAKSLETYHSGFLKDSPSLLQRVKDYNDFLYLAISFEKPNIETSLKDELMILCDALQLYHYEEISHEVLNENFIKPFIAIINDKNKKEQLEKVKVREHTAFYYIESIIIFATQYCRHVEAYDVEIGKLLTQLHTEQIKIEKSYNFLNDLPLKGYIYFKIIDWASDKISSLTTKKTSD